MAAMAATAVEDAVEENQDARDAAQLETQSSAEADDTAYKNVEGTTMPKDDSKSSGSGSEEEDEGESEEDDTEDDSISADSEPERVAKGQSLLKSGKYLDFFADKGFIDEDEEESDDSFEARNNLFCFEDYTPPVSLGPATQKMPLPNELMFDIIHHLAQEEIISIAHLAASCRSFYNYIHIDPGWEARARSLGASKCFKDTDWYYTWRRQYRLVCRDCDAVLLDEQDEEEYDPYEFADSTVRFPYLFDEPLSIHMCRSCAKSYGIVESLRGVPTGLLSTAEIEELAENRGKALQWWDKDDVRVAVGAKLARRRAELDGLRLNLTEEQQRELESLIGSLADPYPWCSHRKLKALAKATNAPSLAALRSVVSINRRRKSIEVNVMKAVQGLQGTAQQRQAIAKKAIKALDWLCAESKHEDERDERHGMSRWRDELVVGQQSLARFIKEVQNPTISHSSKKCRGYCSRTPALACTNGMCGGCCSGDGCARHYDNLERRSRFYGHGYSSGDSDYDYDRYDRY